MRHPLIEPFHFSNLLHRRWLLLLGTSRPLPPPAGTGRCVLGEWLGTAGGRSVPSEERRLPMGPRAPGVGVSCRLPGRGRPGAGCWSLFFLWFKRLDCLRIRVGGLPTMQETWVRSLGWKGPLEKEMAIHSSTLAWKIPGTDPIKVYSWWSIT